MHSKNYTCWSFLLAFALQMYFVQLLKAQERILGIVDDRLVEISPVNGAATVVANLSPALGQHVYEATYHPGKCMLYTFMDPLTVPKLVSIALDGTTSLVGTITLPGNTIGDVESISYNPADGQVYVSARLNLPVGPGQYFSASILQLNVDNAVASLVGAVGTQGITADVDGMTHYNGDFITVDASAAPGSVWSYFFRFSPGLIGSGTNIPQIHATSSFSSSIDLTVYQDEVYFTHDRKLYKADPDNFIPVLIGQMHTANQFGGDMLQAITAVTPGIAFNISLGPDLELCTGEIATLEIPGFPGASFVWSNGATGPSTSVSTSGIYSVQATQESCWSDTDTVVVNFNEPPAPILLGPDLELCIGESATLEIQDIQGAAIVWSNGVTGPVNLIEEAGMFWVQVTQGGCTVVSDTISANFIECPDTSTCNHNYFIPLAFSPNGDGINDRFNVFFGEDGCELEQIQVKIFDRWGELVFEESSLSGWDGSFRNKPAISDVYVYLVTMVFNEGGIRIRKNIKGDVTLLR